MSIPFFKINFWDHRNLVVSGRGKWARGHLWSNALNEGCMHSRESDVRNKYHNIFVSF